MDLVEYCTIKVLAPGGKVAMVADNRHLVFNFLSGLQMMQNVNFRQD